jgi:hypothetical protein
MEMSMIGLYSPPAAYSYGRTARVWNKTVDEQGMALDGLLAKLPKRTTPIVFMDLSSELGTCEQGGQEDEEIVGGEFMRRQQKRAATVVLEVLGRHHLCYIDTYYDTAPTYYSKTSNSHIDHIALPCQARQSVHSCRTDDLAARRAQLIVDSRPRDHIPVVTTLEHLLAYPPKVISKTRWDKDSIAKALQVGNKQREDFFRTIRTEVEKHNWQEVEKLGTPDKHCEAFLKIIMQAVEKNSAVNEAPQKEELQRVQTRLYDLRKERF